VRIQHDYRSQPQDRFHDSAGLSNEALCQQIEQAAIDLLVDLNGYSTIGRLPLFTVSFRQLTGFCLSGCFSLPQQLGV